MASNEPSYWAIPSLNPGALKSTVTMRSLWLNTLTKQSKLMKILKLQRIWNWLGILVGLYRLSTKRYSTNVEPKEPVVKTKSIPGPKSIELKKQLDSVQVSFFGLIWVVRVILYFRHKHINMYIYCTFRSQIRPYVICPLRDSPLVSYFSTIHY